jgi:AbrB family looped-hinge helix DNA binding protein
MALSTITSKGQVTIPKRVRERLRLRTGDKLDFRIDEDGTIRVYPISKTVSEVFGVFAERAKRPYTTKQIDERLTHSLKKRKKRS